MLKSFVSSFAQRGNALLATLIIASSVGLALNLSSDQMQGLHVLAQVEHAKLEARLAAESVAALVEGKLKQFGAEDTAFLSKELEETNKGIALDFPGHQKNKDVSVPGFRLGNCLVWWRVEPIKVWTETIENEGASAEGKYAINPSMDPSNASVDLAYKDKLTQSDFFKENDRNFLFRIVAEAYVLKDPQNTSADPRAKASDRVCSAQAARVVQYTLVNLFEYAIFYAAKGATGDLEFWQGTGMSVNGRVHSNGAIYIGGQGTGHKDGKYHSAASAGGGLAIGSQASPTTVTGVDGIYRMRKPVNYLAKTNNIIKASLDPYAIPTNGLTGENDFNGDSPTSTLHTINGQPFNSANDSRSTALDNKMMINFQRRVRDKYTGASYVESLANVPRFAGRPFEPDMIGGESQWLYAKEGTTPVALAEMSIQQKHANFVGKGTYVYYKTTPFTKGSVPTLTTNPTQCYLPASPLLARVSANNLPLYWQEEKKLTLDINKSYTFTDTVDTDNGFDPTSRSILLNNQIALDKKGLAGLVIRERPTPVGNLVYPFAYVTGLPDSPTATERAAMATHLKAQYQVRFQNEDITEVFFNDLTTSYPVDAPHLVPCEKRRQAIATEEFIMNKREAHFMGKFFSLTQDDYYVNILTLNLRRVQEWLEYMPMKLLHTKFASKTGMAKDYFNGVIYAHRTRRSDSYHPISRPWWVFNSAVKNDFTPPTQVALDATPLGFPYTARERHGPIETFHAGIRIRGGLVDDGGYRAHMASINWQHPKDNAGNVLSAPLGTSKITFITPNFMYLWGDLNTTAYSDGKLNQRVPVAVFADSVTLLSAAWKDENFPKFDSDRPKATHTAYVSSFVINNLPCYEWNSIAEGSGAVANVCRFLEDWGGNSNTWPNPLGLPDPGNYKGQVVFTFMGSLVVMNSQRYSRSLLGAGTNSLVDTGFYSPPFRNLAYNTDLKLAAGQPPESLRALDTTRVLCYVNIFEY